tara:strand:+ start:1793 stop:2035 length:243 start_codon:yes stop_codon:yes gene_type:complete
MARFDFNGKSVLVTGASADVGNAIAAALRDTGATVLSTHPEFERAAVRQVSDVNLTGAMTTSGGCSQRWRRVPALEQGII